MRIIPWVSWITSLFGVYYWVQWLAGNWSSIAVFIWGISSGIGLFIYLRRTKPKFASTRIELGQGTGFTVKTDSITSK